MSGVSVRGQPKLAKWIAFFSTTLVYLGATAEAHANPPVTSARANGVYTLGQDLIAIRALGKGRFGILFDLRQTGRQGQDVSGYALGDLKLDDGVATYTPAGGASCRIRLTFAAPDRLQVEEEEGRDQCFDNMYVHASGTFRKTKSGVPVFESAESPSRTSVLSAQTTSSVPLASLGLLENAIGYDQGDAKESTKSAVDARDAATRLATKAKELEAQLKAATADFSKHARAGAAAYHTYLTSVRKGTPSARDLDALRLAHDEYTASLGPGKPLPEQSTRLRATTDELGRGVQGAKDAATAASGSAKDAAAALAVMKALEQKLVQVAAKKKTPETTQDAAHATSQRQRAEQSVKDLAAAASTANNAAKETAKLAGAAATQTASQRAQTAKSDARQKRDVATAEQALQATTRALKRPNVAPVCDIRKVDWANFGYEGGPTLNAGHFSQTLAGGLEEGWSLGDIVYADTDGNGSPEAFVYIQYSNGTLGGDLFGQQTHVLQLDANCLMTQLGTIPGAGKLVGAALQVEQSYAKPGEPLAAMTGNEISKWKVVQGAVVAVSDVRR